MSRDRAHMAAIGREGGHSRGARARAASTAGTVAAVAAGAAAVAGAAYAATHRNRDEDLRTDVSQGTGSPFVRQANEERSGFEAGGGRNSNVSGGYGERSENRNNDSGSFNRGS